jgi:hypothetical protein
MKTSELIKKLQILQDEHGDSELRFTTQDSYSIYGEEMTLDLRVGETTGKPSDYNGFAHDGNGWTTLQFSLSKNYEGKNPKITFRK